MNFNVLCKLTLDVDSRLEKLTLYHYFPLTPSPTASEQMIDRASTKVEYEPESTQPHWLQVTEGVAKLLRKDRLGSAATQSIIPISVEFVKHAG